MKTTKPAKRIRYKSIIGRYGQHHRGWWFLVIDVKRLKRIADGNLIFEILILNHKGVRALYTHEKWMTITLTQSSDVPLDLTDRFE